MSWTTVTDALDRMPDELAGLLYVALLVLAILVVNLVLRRILKVIIKRRDAGISVWSEALFDALGPPLRAIVWIIGLTVAVKVLVARNEIPPLSSLFPPARDVLATLVIAWFFFRMVRRVEANYHARARKRGETIDATTTDAISKLAFAVIITTSALIIMQTLGFSIAGLLAFGGAAGIAVGFAAQSLVANLFGGLTIFVSRIFRIGEDIIIPGTDLAGTVESIGWRSTRVLGWDYKPFYVPNSTTIINHTRNNNRRIMEYVHLRYCDIEKVEAIIADGNEMIAKHPTMDHDYWVFRFDSYGDFSLKLFLYAFADTKLYDEYMRTKEDVLLKLAAIVHKHGGELAIPVSEVYMPRGVELNHKSGGEPFLGN